MSHKRRIQALECVQKKRGPASLEAARLFFDHLHQAYGPRNTPPPVLTDEEVRAAITQFDADLDAMERGDYEPQL